MRSMVQGWQAKKVCLKALFRKSFIVQKTMGNDSYQLYCRERLRYVLYEVAAGVVSHSPELQSIQQYYATKEKNPLKKMRTMIAVVRKLIRVFYLILQTGLIDDAAKLLGDIRRSVTA